MVTEIELYGALVTAGLSYIPLIIFQFLEHTEDDVAQRAGSY